ncbi:MAG: ATP-binding cassette domain-containing protein, partial [Candidatus Limiplasma sp.]|nr:ATP-binding cassette domain-containing protein [Candidatus Limiplasma sp.]
MMVDVKDISVSYLTGDLRNRGLKEYLMLRVRGQYQTKVFNALRGISFSLDRGDMMGIVGTNGAGKSTLLKVISGIMLPTQGTCQTHGRIAALLELGAGFDGEMTVKENTYLRGAMMGYTKEFMNRMYPEIIAFAELESFQDRPFKHLSSGMRSRLAFSICS